MRESFDLFSGRTKSNGGLVLLEGRVFPTVAVSGSGSAGLDCDFRVFGGMILDKLFV